MRIFLTAALLTSALTTTTTEAATTIVSDVGAAGHGFSDGDILSITDILGVGTTAAAGGSDPSANFSGGWTHTFTIPMDPVIAAALTIGIYDSDAGGIGLDESDGTTVVTAADEQLDFFTVGSAMTSVKPQLLAAGFELPGQALNNQFEIYTIALPPSVFPDFATGTLDVALGLKGPVFSPAGLPFLDDLVHDSNGANVIFSTLTIDTVAIPEPKALTGLSALVPLVLRRRCRKVGMKRISH